jgi:hypothetical protein
MIDVVYQPQLISEMNEGDAPAEGKYHIIAICFIGTDIF